MKFRYEMDGAEAAEMVREALASGNASVATVSPKIVRVTPDSEVPVEDMSLEIRFVASGETPRLIAK